jgi:hypothetical protein
VHPDDVGLYALAAGIVQQAIEDYREAEKRMKNPPNFVREGDRRAYIYQCENEKRDIIKFFRSEWYGVLCDIDPERILRILGVRS